MIRIGALFFVACGFLAPSGSIAATVSKEGDNAPKIEEWSFDTPIFDEIPVEQGFEASPAPVQAEPEDLKPRYNDMTPKSLKF